jgi:uncharacterized membrane protein YqjE
MNSGTPGSSSLLGSLRGLADSLLGSAHDRIELLSIELHEEKFRLIQTLVWIAAIAFTAMLGLIFASLILVFLFWDTARVTVTSALAIFYLGAFTVALVSFRRFIARQPRPFAGTLGELQQDRACIRAES